MFGSEFSVWLELFSFSSQVALLSTASVLTLGLQHSSSPLIRGYFAMLPFIYQIFSVHSKDHFLQIIPRAIYRLIISSHPFQLTEMIAQIQDKANIY